MPGNAFRYYDGNAASAFGATFRRPLMLMTTTIMVLVVDATLNCSICPSGSTMGSPDRNYSWATAPTTCLEFDQNIAPSFINDEGLEECGLDGFWIDMASYCNCTNYTKNYTCDFCASGTIINPDLRVDAPEGSDLMISLTCEQAGLATEFVSDEGTCLSLKLLFAPSCCQIGSDVPASSPAASGTCSICPSESTIQNPDKSLFFIGDGLTCGKGEAILTGLTTEAECAAAKNRFDELPFDVSAWCECSGTSPPDACALCSRSANGAFISPDDDATTAVDLGNNITVSCREADQLAAYITDTSVCRNNYEIGIKDCCTGVPTSPDAPTPSIVSQTPAPTFATSSGTRLLNERMLVGVLLWIPLLRML